MQPFLALLQAACKPGRLERNKPFQMWRGEKIVFLALDFGSFFTLTEHIECFLSLYAFSKQELAYLIFFTDEYIIFSFKISTFGSWTF